MAKTVNVRIKIRADTFDNWTAKNPVLLYGEISYVTDVNKFKVGDGKTIWTGLEYTNQVKKISQIANDAGYAPIVIGTKAEWDAKTGTPSAKGTIYVYTDYYKDSKENEYPAVKIGDGNAYIGDLPIVNGYVDLLLQDHINDKTIHITDDERKDWNNKVSCEVSGETLVFSL